MIYPTDHLTYRQMVDLRRLGELRWGGHIKSKIYGTLDCPGAKRWMARGHYRRHRVFFKSESEARTLGYRPCANCMPEDYKVWKSNGDARV